METARNDGQRLFGTPLRTRTLYAIGALKRTYAAEIAAAIGSKRQAVQRILDSLEDEGVILSSGTSIRFVTLNPRFVAIRELTALLDRLVETDDAFFEQIARIRRRPRRRGKPVVTP
jgi:DNA-binding MarR family transcriptional regulator